MPAQGVNSLSAPLARGLASELYSWGEGRVLKLFYSGTSREHVQREFQITRLLNESGLPVPEVFELLEIEGRFGFSLQFIEGETLLHSVERRPWTLVVAARRFAEFHAQLHQWRVPAGLPSQRDQLRERIEEATRVPEADRRSALACMAELPEGSQVCHGDFHPENIILTAKGPVIIDWSAGSRGLGWADVAQTCALFQKANLPPRTSLHLKVAFGFSRRILHRAYLARYLKVRGGSLQEINRWMPACLVAFECYRSNRHSLAD